MIEKLATVHFLQSQMDFEVSSCILYQVLDSESTSQIMAAKADKGRTTALQVVVESLSEEGGMLFPERGGGACWGL